jgi:hypothetical protein
MIEIVGSEYVNHWNEKQTMAEYHADKTAIGSGKLKTILKSPRTFRAVYEEEQREDTDAFQFGRLVHLAILEPAKFEQTVKLMPDFGDQRSSKNRDAKAAWLAELPPGTELCTQEQLDDLRGMIDSLMAHKEAFAALKNGKTEISGYYRDSETGIKCKIRPDFLQFELNALVDLKTTRDCTREAFSRTVWQYRYDFQLAMYAAGIKEITGRAPKFNAILALEKVKPYEVALYVADEAMMERGELDYRKALRTLKKCITENKFNQPYQTETQSIFLPQWAFYEE